MTTAKIAPQPWLQFIDANGDPYSGGTLVTSLTGTNTAQVTRNGTMPSASNNPTSIPLNTAGIPSYAGDPIEVCLVDGVEYRFTVKDSGGSTVAVYDNIRGINDFVAANIAEWYTDTYSGTTSLGYISGTSFFILSNADISTTYHVGRRIKIFDGVTTHYGTITTTSYNGGTGKQTVTCTDMSVVLSGAFTGTPTISYGILSSVNPSIPMVLLPDGTTAATQAAGTSNVTLATTAFVTTAVAATLHNAVNDFRLSLTSGTPVTSSDVTAATTLYLTPLTGNAMGMYSGSAWSIVTSAQISLPLGGVTTSTTLPYDIFVVNTAGTLSLEAQAWSSANGRANALPRQDGVLVKYGDTTRRYVGTVAPAVAVTPTSGKLDDSVAYRGVWNYYNRSSRAMKYVIGAVSWTYATIAWRACNAVSTYRLNFVNGGEGELSGSSGDTVWMQAMLTSGSATGNNAVLGIGFNSSAAPTSVTSAMGSAATAGANGATVTLNEMPLLGVNYAQMLEYCTTANTQTFYGTSGGILSGIVGTIRG